MKAAVSSHVSIVRRCRFAFSLFAAFPGRLAAVSILAAVLLWAAPSPAQTYDVDTTADSGAGSLRQAVDDLNASGAAGDIRFLSGSSGTIDLTTGGLTLTQQASLLNNSGGAVTVSRSGASDVTALLATSLGTIGGASALAISATATSGTDAYGIYSSGGALSIGAIASTGSITATAGTNYAYGLHGADGVTITGEMAGDIAASSGGQYAHGIYSSGGAISIGSIAESGSIEATAGTNWAYGLYAIAGVTITGEMAGDITATATSGSNARGIYSGGALSIGSIASTGSIMATAGGTTAYGLYGLFGVTIVGEMAGDITATAGGHTALGIWSGGTLGGGGASTPVSISGTVSARANGLAVAVGADGAMNLYVTGTLSGVDTSGSGEGYAIRAGTPDGIGGWNTGSADNNIVTLGHGATIIGKIDLGTGANNALTLLGVPNAATSIARISGVDSLAVGDGTTGTNWTLAPTATSSFGSVAIFPNAALTVNENVAITGDTVNNGALTFDLASNVSYAGVISGSGSLTKAGTATLVLSGDSTYTGSTLVSGGTLDVTGTLASQAYQVDSGATLTLHQNMTLTGTALVNGTMGSPELTIAATGTLAGSGTVTGDVVSSGLISPGNSPGTLTIAGNLYLGAGSTLFMEITPTVSDLVVVSGTTTIAGGALSLDVAQGYYSAGQTFTLLTSAGGITGAFDTITIDDHSQFLVFTVDVGDTAITAGIGGSVSVTRLPYTIAGTSRNAMGAAAGLTGATSLATPSMQVLLGTIDFMDASQVARGLRQMSPEPYSALTETAFSSMGLFSDTIRDRAYARRSGGETLLTAVSAGNIDRLTQLASAAGASDAGSGLSIKGTGTGMALFVKPVGQYQSFDNGHNRTGFQSWQYGVMAGGDAQVTDNFLAGFQVGFVHSNLRFKDDATSTGFSDAFLGGVYASATSGGFYADGLVQAGAAVNHLDRRIEFGSIAREPTGKYTSFLFGASLSTGYDWTFGDWKAGPVATLDYGYVSNPGFAESDPDLGLTVQGFTGESLKTGLGAKVSGTFTVGEKTTVSPDLSLRWGHEFLDDSTTISARYNGSPTSGFTSRTGEPARDSLLVDAGVSIGVSESTKLYVRYSGQFLARGTQTQAGAVGVRYEF